MIALIGLLALTAQTGVPVDRYELAWGGLKASVEVTGKFDEAQASVTTTSGRRTQTQKLNLPAGWHAINAREDWSSNNWDRPAVMKWPGASSPIVVVHVSPLEGVYDTSSLAFWTWTGSRWRLLTKDFSTYGYCDMGGFCFQGSQLHVWSPVYGDDRAHWDAHRFELKVFKLEAGKLKAVSKRQTRHTYLPGRHSPPGKVDRFPPDRVEAVDDPLREFGLVWRWWGKPRS